MAAEFRELDATRALARLDRLAAELAGVEHLAPPEQAEELRRVLGERHGFTGNRDEYDHPDNSMLDLVLDRRTGLPILLSVVYVAVARRAGVPLAGFGLPGHYVVGHVGVDPPLLLDPFNGGRVLEADLPDEAVQPWGAHETALRMLNNLVGSYSARAQLANALRAAELRLVLPLDAATRALLEVELRALRAQLN